MSMTDEGTMPSNEGAASKTTESSASGQHGDNQQGTGLPGLAGFGEMPGYAPVTGEPEQAGASAEQPAEPEPLVDLHDDSYAQDQYQDPHDHAEPSNAGPGADEDGASASFAGEDLYSYMAEHHPSHDETLHQPGAFDSESMAHSDASDHAGGNSLQPFEAHYDQHPKIPLGAFESPGEMHAEQPFFHGASQGGDADFMSEETAPDVAAPKERRGRKILMAASGLIGVLALGGALAFAYKIGGDYDIASAGKPPLIQADSRPVKVAPEKPGGKEFPHKNKKIYERLQGEKGEEVERIVPRQEDVAAAATAPSGSTTPAQGGTAETASAPQPSAAVPGSPRKVKTLTVRPDGTIEAPSPKQKVVKAPPTPAAAPVIAPDGTVTMSFPQPAATPPAVAPAPKPVTPTIPKPAAVTAPPAESASATEQQVAAAPAVAAPPPVQKPQVPRAAATAPEPQQTASAPPVGAPSATSSSNYVVQVAARKSQTDALAAFADIQQKYPQLLSGYRPIIKRADLGNKGVWYRLNVGPVESKKVASALCSQLKSAGMRSCIVRAQ